MAEGEGEAPKGPRVGVFICHCGTNIGGIVDVPAVVEFARTLPDVVYADDKLYACAGDGLGSIRDGIKEHGLNRVVVASCTPRTHAKLFQDACESGGLNKYLFTFVNIREHCSWVHMKDKAGATEKAKDLVSMGVARARMLVPLEESRIDVTKSALVIGGGISGMTAALNLADQGFPVHLVEKESGLGGYLKDLGDLWEAEGDPMKAIEPTVNRVRDHHNITTYLNSSVEDVAGYLGNFAVVIRTGEERKNVEIGVIIVAIGAKEYIPTGFYGYDDLDNVITLAEFERLVKRNEVPDVTNVAFIQCTGARGQDLSYCSRVCCNIALKTALKLKETIESRIEGGEKKEAAPTETKLEAEAPKEEAKAPMRRRRSRRRRDAPGGPKAAGAGAGAPPGGKRANITIFNRTINAYGVHHELNYNKAREKRIKFTKYDLDNIPVVTKAPDGKLDIRYYQKSLAQWRNLKADLLILSTPLKALDGSEKVSKMLKIPRDTDGFFLEAHVKLRPVEFATDGVYLAGTCRAPADLMEAIQQANAAASRASIPLAKGQVRVEAVTAVIDVEKCSGCGTCTSVCGFGALVVKATNSGKKAEVNLAACKGCGACASICPELAISMAHFSNEQLLSEALACVQEEAAE